jgi:hypothetical protein
MRVEPREGILPTPSIPPRAAHPPSMNHLKRDKRRRNRRALYQELQELVLGNVHVRVRLDGRVHPFYDKIMLKLSPTLLENERYNYLVGRLPHGHDSNKNHQTMTWRMEVVRTTLLVLSYPHKRKRKSRIQ